MTTKRIVASSGAVLVLLIASRQPDSVVWTWVRYAALTYMTGDFLLQVRAGYLRRRGHWTRESWRRFLLVCSIPIGALLAMLAMMFAMEWRLPIVGEPRSSLRGVWAAATVILLLLGAGGLAAAVGSLGNGPVTQQFELPRWLRSRDRGAA